MLGAKGRRGEGAQSERPEFGPHHVIALSYAMEDAAGQVLDVATLGAPLVFMYGSGLVIAGLERGLVGKRAGERFRLVIPPEEGFGPADTSRDLTLPRDRFGARVDLGAPFELKVGGELRVFTVVEVRGDEVLLSPAPPLAGVTLKVTGRVVAVRRAASEEEVHGRAMLEDWP